MPRPPPSPTLFPYTTLFRSAASLLVLRTPTVEAAVGEEKELANFEPGSTLGPNTMKNPMVCHIPQGEDRKSTRLNSSHLVISYAVFCLKKKIYLQCRALTCA